MRIGLEIQQFGFKKHEGFVAAADEADEQEEEYDDYDKAEGEATAKCADNDGIAEAADDSDGGDY